MERLSDEDFLLRRVFLAAKPLARADMDLSEDEWGEFYDAMASVADHLGFGEEFDAMLEALPEPEPLPPGVATRDDFARHALASLKGGLVTARFLK